MSNDRWIKRSWRPVSGKEFVRLVESFYKAMEEALGAKCRLEITALDKAPCVLAPIDDSSLKDMREADDKATIHRTDNPATLNREIWKQAASIQVNVRPIEENAAPPSAWGHMTFDKKDAPRKIEFYVTPGGLDAETLMRRLSLLKKLARADL